MNFNSFLSKEEGQSRYRLLAGKSDILFPVHSGHPILLWRSYQTLEVCYRMIEGHIGDYEEQRKLLDEFIFNHQIREIRATQIVRKYRMSRLLHYPRDGSNWFVAGFSYKKDHPAYGEYVAWSTLITN